MGATGKKKMHVQRVRGTQARLLAKPDPCATWRWHCASVYELDAGLFERPSDGIKVVGNRHRSARFEIAYCRWADFCESGNLFLT